jgi:hypothetical protein
MFLFSNKSISVYALLLFFNYSTSQELFHEIELGKKITVKDAFFMVDLNWKKEYRNAGWNRIGLNVSFLKPLKNNWNVSGGLENYYVLDSKSTNNYELRPWAMISLKSKISNTLYFSQFFKTEWRNFFYLNTNEYHNYQRLRYRFHFDWIIYKKEKQVSLKPGIEWYLLKNTSNGERFANSKEFYLRCSIEKSGNEWNFGYKRESFYETIQPNSDNVNTLFFEYKF